MSTKDNLEEAFGGESEANRKYLAFASRAESDGYEQVAHLFRSIAAAETIHAHNHLRALGKVGSTEENLQEAIDGEDYEYQDMYPEFLEEAKKEGETEAQTGFRFALEAEEVHSSLYNEALQAVEAGEDLPDREIHLCEVCGHTVIGEPPENCPICGSKKEKYFQVDR